MQTFFPKKNKWENEILKALFKKQHPTRFKWVLKVLQVFLRYASPAAS